jgi:hypothetical protein
MLNYGTAAQKEFGYRDNEEEYANAQVGDYQQYATKTENLNWADERVMGTNYQGTSVVHESNLILTMYFKNITADMYAEITYRNHSGDDVSYRIEGENFYFRSATLIGVDIDTLLAADGDVLTTIKAISNSITRYTYVPPPLEKTTSLTFTSIEGTETRGVGVREIAIYLSEGEIIYTNYITHCDEASYIDNVVVKSVNDRRKILLNGCLYIQIDGQLYDSMGMTVK